MKLDIVIPLLGEDISTFLRGYEYILNYLPVKKIILICPSSICDNFKGFSAISCIDENTLLEGLSISRIKEIKKDLTGNVNRSGWYFQQFLKMAYSLVCKDEYYLIWDSDTIPLQKISFFDSENKPYLGYKEYQKFDDCYLQTQEKILPNLLLRKKVRKSFIAEHMLIKTSIMREIISDIEASSGKVFYEHIMNCIPLKYINLSGFSEFECYAAYVLAKYPNDYTLRSWRNLRNGKTYIGNKFNEKDIKWISQSFCSVSIEAFDRQWIICKIIILLRDFFNISFKKTYALIQPVADFEAVIREKLRRIIK